MSMTSWDPVGALLSRSADGTLACREQEEEEQDWRGGEKGGVGCWGGCWGARGGQMCPPATYLGGCIKCTRCSRAFERREKPFNACVVLLP